MSHKYCSCLEITPTYCINGWKVCKCAWYYTQGCEKLLVGTDHKPLLGVFNDRSMESIDNPRLIHLKEKTLGWSFKIIHILGKKLHCPEL
jgi:hypothetical protein